MGHVDPSLWPDLHAKELKSLYRTAHDLLFLLEVVKIPSVAGFPAWRRRRALFRMYSDVVARAARHYRKLRDTTCLAARCVGTREAMQRTGPSLRTLGELVAATIGTALALHDAFVVDCRKELNEELERACARGGTDGTVKRMSCELWAELAPASTLSLPLRQHRKREGASLDPGAIFEGANGSDADRALGLRLAARKQLIAEAAGVDAALRRAFGVPIDGLETLRQSIRRAVRSAYASEAPPEGLIRVNRIPLVREVRSDPETGEITDIGEYLMAGGDFPEGLSLESICLQGEERAEHVRRVEAAFREDRGLLGLSPKEADVVRDYLIEAPRRGYSPSSKRGISLRQFWGDHYDARRKMLQRVRKHHPDFFAKWECLTPGAEAPGPR